ncbi:ANTAR domain-containing protein [Nakamurella sp. YIM 132087]|uniref:ANTAR domain-containing protein n=1 Tax=Nakamurella alba TaxID=2665158 RepID=A0A7K1FLJ9_9ACTN|nr:GAF and ANTAR domain-containing protein [Nakamurella alba]MTD14940.1 ANTAR domain-containing protein [Nakamurella alba]
MTHEWQPAELAERTRRALGAEEDDALLSLARAAVEAGLADLAAVGRRGIDGDGPTVVGATDPLAQAIGDLEHTATGGPVRSLIDSGDDLLTIGDVATAPAWPEWSAAAAATGIRQMTAVRLHADRGTLGALLLYRTTSVPWTGPELELAKLIGVHASIVLAHADGTAHLWRAIDARNRIGQAQGILMERFSLAADTAFEVLRRYSQTTGTKLQSIADDLVRTRKLPQSDSDGPAPN